MSKSTKRPKFISYVAKQWEFSNFLTVGRFPAFTSPPMVADKADSSYLDPSRLSADILYLRLHGSEGQPYLYGDPGWVTALTVADVLRCADEVFRDTIVFLEGCFGENFSDAFIDRGAKSVVGTDRITYGRPFSLGHSGRVGRTWLKNIRRGRTVSEALERGLRKTRKPYNQGWLVYGNESAKLEMEKIS